jgi:hypothetical protein
VQPGLHCAETDTEFGGNLSMAEPLQVEQQHRLALAGREVGDGVTDSLSEHGGLGDLLRSGTWIGEVAAGKRTEPAGFLQPASGHVQSDATQPWTEASRLGESVQAHQRNHDRLLASIKGQVVVI